MLVVRISPNMRSFQTRWAHSAGQWHPNKWAHYFPGCSTVDHIRYVEHIARIFGKTSQTPPKQMGVYSCTTIGSACSFLRALYTARRCAHFAKLGATSRQDGGIVPNNRMKLKITEDAVNKQRPQRTSKGAVFSRVLHSRSHQVS